MHTFVVIGREVGQRVQREMRLAHQARDQGNEGMARVCARRAAGWAIGAWLAEHTLKPTTSAAQFNLRAIAGDINQPSRIRLAATHLTSRVNTEHVMPDDADLLSDAELLIEHFKILS